MSPADPRCRRVGHSIIKAGGDPQVEITVPLVGSVMELHLIRDETDGVLDAWFSTHRCEAALVRPASRCTVPLVSRCVSGPVA